MLNIHQNFTNLLLQWYEYHGRKDLPWQSIKQAYPIWISEIMLQQTQVKTVIPYFLRFIKQFPDVRSLAFASEDNVLSHWSGLGYYSRARNLHQTAKIITETYQGEFPQDITLLVKLPGIGESTAAAIASLAFDQPAAILDGNVRRVLSRFFMINGSHDQASVKKQLWAAANLCMSKEQCADYTQAIMDMGATCCKTKKPDCLICPLKKDCQAYQQGVVDQYPNKKIKKIIPTKEQQFLLIYNDNHQIYLEKKPPTGLWAGLWCLPSIDLDCCPNTFILKQYQMNTESPEELMTLKHSFSHYHLNIKALTLRCVSMKENRVSEGYGRWYYSNELQYLGLAKPVSIIINQFYPAYVA